MFSLLLLLFALFLIALSVFLFLLIPKLMVIVAWTAPEDVREKVVQDAERWFNFAKIAAILVPFGVLYLVLSPLTGF